MNVCFLFGINGVGKSTIAEAIKKLVPECMHVSASLVLREVFGSVTREDLERMDPASKHRMLRTGLVAALGGAADAPLVVCDTHLVVPIRKGQAPVVYEEMWDEAFMAFGRAFCNVVSTGELILYRRQHDEATTGRRRNVCPSDIEADAERNAAAFRGLFAGNARAFAVRNEGNVQNVARMVLLRALVNAAA